MIVVRLKGDVCKYLASHALKSAKKRAGHIQLFFYCNFGSQSTLTETNLGKNSLASQKFRAESNYEAHHCEPPVPLLSEA